MRGALLLAIALLVGVEGLAAQAQACTPEAMARDTVRYALVVQARLGRDTLPDSAASIIAGEAILGAGFRIPSTIANAFPAGAQPREFAPRDEITLSRVMAYPSTGAGIATVRQPPRRLAEPTTDSVFRVAAERADVHPILPHRDGSDTLPVTLELVATRANDVGFTLARLALPRVLYDTPVQVKRVTGRFEMPEILKRLNTGGAVRFRFVVLPDGTVDPNSVTAVETSHPELVEPATTSLLTMRYEPAKAGRCPVASLVEETVRYTVTTTRMIRQ
jgi:hypothetical protein